MMIKAKIYTKPACPYCMRAKMLLEQNGYTYDEIDVRNPEDFEKLKKRTGLMTVPQIYIGEEFIGGCDDLEKWLEKNKSEEE